ncbi:MerR family transcriptional regulator [Priestia megaterium]|uniref:MerR family transcriptional regulator n=1 Tax=Priestia megaterium TaxID=1404 RepID=UPI001BECD0B2|nr:MerR family transcriptional regulator [Priestia megaterium]MBT2259781.1 MerR family transcriptional regulator [Priestia megaterium]MBT2281700.1 MerR family transcriptional regulator [Priestia megaterium]
MEKSLLTIAEIAKELDMPESTVRYYRDRFINYIPFTGKGRGRRYRRETIDILRFIAEGFNRSLNAAEIEEGLSLMVARNMEVENETAATTAAAQQQPNLNEISVQINMDKQFHELMNQVTVTMQLMAHQKEEINELRNQQEEQKKYIDELLDKQSKKRDIQVMDVMKEVLEVRKQITMLENQRNEKKWWMFWK